MSALLFNNSKFFAINAPTGWAISITIGIESYKYQWPVRNVFRKLHCSAILASLVVGNMGVFIDLNHQNMRQKFNKNVRTTLGAPTINNAVIYHGQFWKTLFYMTEHCTFLCLVVSYLLFWMKSVVTSSTITFKFFCGPLAIGPIDTHWTSPSATMC